MDQSNRNLREMSAISLFVNYQTPCAWKAGRGVYSVKTGDSEKIFDFAIALGMDNPLIITDLKYHLRADYFGNKSGFFRGLSILFT